jgi:hypothetical protein
VTPPEPADIARLPHDKHHRPVPWFVAWIEGEPDFRILKAGAVGIAWHSRTCWVCGLLFQRQEPRAFLIGPMCAVNLISVEPPSHYECAQYSAMACPFLTTPNMVRRSRRLPVGVADPPGVMLRRNPGVSLVWVTKYNQPQRDRATGLFHVGRPLFVEWYAHGRTANRGEVLASIDSGLPALAEACQGDQRQLAALDEATATAMKLVPPL